MKEKILMIVFILVLGTLLTSALIAVDYYTLPYIEKNEAQKQKVSVLVAFAVPIDEKSESIEDVFAENVEVTQRGERTFYISKNGEIAFQFSGSGLWGPITGVLALGPDVKTIKRIVIMHQEETPGLGSRIAEKSYLDGYNGKTFSPLLRLMQPGRGTQADEVDAIAGATMSSNAFVQILNSQMKEFSSAFKGETQQ
ncbi:MAG TPA: FMN-binding protein [Spirochaetia bacterium]|nr:FMN-binding protein [Spirochaetia bacterium]